MTHHAEWGRFARVIASDLVEYSRHRDSRFADAEVRAREFASHGLALLRGRFGIDEALERYYADCVGSAFESLSLTPPSLLTLREAATSFVVHHPPEEAISLVFGASKPCA
jgi:hypothetical protein